MTDTHALLVETLAVTGELARDAKADRDQVIVDAHREGLTLRAIGTAAGLSHAAVRKIVLRGCEGL